MSKQKLLILTFLAVLLPFMAFAAISPTNPFHVLWDDAPRTFTLGSDFEIDLTIQVPEGYYLYADETEVDFSSLEGLIITEIEYPKSSQYLDPFIDKNVDVYKGDVRIAIKGEVPEGLALGEHELTTVLRFRGCSPKLCFRPEQREIPISINVGGKALDENAPIVTAKPKERPLPTSIQQKLGLRRLLEIRDFSVVLESGALLAIVIVFLAGILTSLTPCVWPVIPAVLLFVGVHPHKRFWENLLLAATLVGGLILTYSLLGIGAVAFGKNLGFLYQQRWFLLLVVLFFLAMSLSMLGAFDIRLPRKWHNCLHKLGGEGYRGALLAGIGLGLVASPCSGPVLAAILGYVALQGSFVTGFALLVVYASGMGLLMVLLGACYAELVGRLKGGTWMLWIKRVLGVALLFPAVFYMGSLLGFGRPVPGVSDIPRVEWITNEEHALQFARQSRRPIILEFTALWCPPCRKLERDFFSLNRIVDLSYMMVPLRVDATIETKEVRKLIRKYNVMSWPTVLFLNSEGKSYNDLRVNDYDPAAIEKGMKEAIKRLEKRDKR
ncbi:MAG: cytochrome c biogenesis protein CcdA [Pseudomonadota bacterium]